MPLGVSSRRDAQRRADFFASTVGRLPKYSVTTCRIPHCRSFEDVKERTGRVESVHAARRVDPLSVSEVLVGRRAKRRSRLRWIVGTRVIASKGAIDILSQLISGSSIDESTDQQAPVSEDGAPRAFRGEFRPRDLGWPRGMLEQVGSGWRPIWCAGGGRVCERLRAQLEQPLLNGRISAASVLDGQRLDLTEKFASARSIVVGLHATVRMLKRTTLNRCSSEASHDRSSPTSKTRTPRGATIPGAD